jgi:molybdopterin molybdotransferase
MISVQEAKKIIVDHVKQLTDVISIKTADSLGYNLAQDIYSPLDLPPFNQSNVDGYAVKFSNKNNNSYNVVSEIKAGDDTTLELKAGEAVRIFTGAMVPKNANCIIMQEKIIRTNTTITCDGIELKIGEHIRKKGSQIKKSELAIKQNTFITPSVIGFISSLGINEVKVYRKPKINLIITGNELQFPGTDLKPGKVFESNSPALTSALKSIGLGIAEILFINDDKNSLATAINNTLPTCDLLLISGGISVGDYDFVNEILTENKTETLFYKIAQKPGKPLFFGKNNNTFVFGLPGNPASALTCFYEYVYPCIKKLQGRNSLFLPTIQLPLENEIIKKKGLAHFLKAKVNLNSVQVLDGQESYKIKSFAEANAFIYLPAESENIKVGEMVEVHLLPVF